MAVSVNVYSGATTMKGLLEGPQANIYLASETSLEDRRVLLNSPVPLKTLVNFSGYFRDALETVTEASKESVVAQAGLHKHIRETAFAPAQVAQASDGVADITIVCGDTLPDEAFRIVFCWMLGTRKSGRSEKILEQLNFTDLTYCMMVNELLAVPSVLKDQVSRLLAKIAEHQVSLEDVKASYACTPLDHPVRSLIVKSIGKAYLEKRLKSGKAYYNYSHDNDDFAKDLLKHLCEHQASGNPQALKSSTFTEGQTLASVESGYNDWPAAGGDLVIEESDAICGPPKAPTGICVTTCGNKALKTCGAIHVATQIVSFDGPADEWSTPVPISGNDWSQGADEWQETAVSAGGYQNGWGYAADDSSTNNNNGWGDDVDIAGGTAGRDDDTCRRCKQPGHFARECPEPHDDSCFNCGQPGHIARDCTEPKKVRGGDRTCHKCNQVGHIARDCPTGGGGGDRACHKCGEAGHIARECTSSEFGAAGGGGSGGMQCYNCQQFGHKSGECTNEPVERQYGSDPRTCNKCDQKGHISRDCREDGGDTYSTQHGGDDYGHQYDARYDGGGYGRQGGLYDPNDGTEGSGEPLREEMINVTVSATRVRKGKRGRPGYVDITEQMYDPRAFDEPRYGSSSRGGPRRGGGRARGGRGSQGGRGAVGGGYGNGGHGSNGEAFSNENVPPPATADAPTIAVEGEWADASDSLVPASSGW